MSSKARGLDSGEGSIPCLGTAAMICSNVGIELRVPGLKRPGRSLGTLMPPGAAAKAAAWSLSSMLIDIGIV